MPESEEQAAPTRGRPVDPRLLRYASASRLFFVAIGAIGLAQTLVIVAFAWALTQVVVGVLAGDDVGALLGWLAGTAALRAVLLWAREIIAARAAARVELQLRAHLLEAVARLGAGWLGTANTARLAVTAGRGLDALDAYFGRYLPQLVQTIIATPILISVMWWQDWISGLIVVLTIPLIPLFMVLIGLATRAVQQKQWATLQTLAARFADTVQGLSTLTVFGRQHRAANSIERVTGTYRTETMRVLRVSFLSGFALEFLASVAVAIVAVTIGFRLIDGSLALSVGLFVLLLAPEAYLPIRQVGVQFHAASEGVAATEDVFAVLDAARAATPVTAAAAAPTAPVDGALELRAVRVQRGDHALPPVSFRAAPGTVTLIEGPSGAGKSSLLAALRGAAVFDGTITLGTADASTHPASTWLAWAGQDPGLIAGSIAENITLGDPAPRADLVARSLVLSCAVDLDPAQELGVQGAGISGGQAQRVAVARAFYRRARGWGTVVALDEPSAALDERTESALWASVREIADSGAIVLLVSHRTSARAIADHVVTLETAAVPT